MDRCTDSLEAVIKTVRAGTFEFGSTERPVVRSVIHRQPKRIHSDGRTCKPKPNADNETRYILLGSKLCTEEDAVSLRMTIKFAKKYPEGKTAWELANETRDKRTIKAWTKLDNGAVVPWQVAQGSRPLQFESSEAMANAGIPIACSCPDWQYSRFKPPSSTKSAGPGPSASSSTGAAPKGERRMTRTEDSARRRRVYLAPQGCKHMIAWRIKQRLRRQMLQQATDMLRHG